MWKWMQEIMLQPENMTEEQEYEYFEDRVLFWIRIILIMIAITTLVSGMCWVTS